MNTSCASARMPRLTAVCTFALVLLGLGRPTSALGDSRWTSWWDTNREATIAHWADVTPGRSYAGWANSVMGRGRSFLPPTRLSPGERRRATEALYGVLSKTNEITLRTRMTYAIARVAPEDMHTKVRELLERLLSDMSANVRVSATFALGILGDPEATDTLVGIALDDARARISLRQSIASNAVRGHAVMALGMLNSPAIIDELLPILELDDTDDAYVQRCIVFALGMLEGELAIRAREVLLDKLENLPRDRAVAGMIPIALGKLGHREAMPAVLEVLGNTKAEREMRQSAAVAMSRLTSLYDEEAIEELFDNVKTAAEGPQRWYSLMSIALIGARTRRPAQPFDHEDLEKRLIEEMVNPSHEEHGPWAAMALAVYGIDHEVFRPLAIEAVGPAYKKEKDPDDKGAYAIALGLLGAREYGKQIFADLDDLSDGAFRGSAALALGMLAYEPAREWMLKRALDKSATAGERIRLFRGLALMGDRGTTKAILGEWKTSGDAARRSSLASGLARMRNPRALERLIAMIVDDGATQPREEAASALGLHSDRSNPRFHELLTQDVNPGLGVPANLVYMGY